MASVQAKSPISSRWKEDNSGIHAPTPTAPWTTLESWFGKWIRPQHFDISGSLRCYFVGNCQVLSFFLLCLSEDRKKVMSNSPSSRFRLISWVINRPVGTESVPKKRSIFRDNVEFSSNLHHPSSKLTEPRQHQYKFSEKHINHSPFGNEYEPFFCIFKLFLKQISNCQFLIVFGTA